MKAQAGRGTGNVFTGIAAALLVGTVFGFVPDRVASAQSIEGPQVQWNLSAWGTRRAQSEGIEALSALVSERTGGKFTVKINYGESLSSSRENIDGVKIGAFEAAHVANSFHPGKLPTMNVFDLPFLPLSDLATQARVMLKYYEHPAVKADLQRWSAIGLLPVLLPAYEMQGKGKAPTSLQVFSGMRVRAPGGLGAVMKTVGAVPTTVPASEVYGALERGLVDSIAQPHYAAISWRTHEISEWYTTNLSMGILGVVTVINEPAWSKLPPQYRKLMQDSVPTAILRQIKAYDIDQSAAIKAMRDRGMKEIKLSAADHAKLVEASRPIWDSWVAEMNAKSYPGAELLALVLREAAATN